MIRPLLLALFSATPAVADITVVTDIAPVHSLTAAVMAGTGTPTLLIPGASDPHDVQMRPSDAARLVDAELVIWVGPDLTPWLSAPLDTLAAETPRLALLETVATMALHLSEDDDGHDHDHADDQDALDPHAWLDPQLAAVWTTEIAAALAAADPENGPAYLANADKIHQQLEALDTEIAAQLAPLKGALYLSPHDGLAYFETRYGLPAAGHVTDSHAQAPGPAHLADLRDRIAAEGITCVLTPTGPDPGWTSILTQGTSTKTAPIDLTGATLALGPDLYPNLIRGLTQALTE